jgi:hypothetical protein
VGDGTPGCDRLLAVVAAITDLSAWPALVWERADQIALTAVARALLRGGAHTYHYLLALPAGLAMVIAASRLDGVAADGANGLKLILLPVAVGVVLPTSFGLLGRTVRRGRSAVVWATLLAITTAAYLAFPPDWVPERNPDLVPRLASGLVFARRGLRCS